MVKMSDIFLQQDIDKVLHNKFIVIIGDSIQRAIYKDIVLLLQQNKYLTEQHLRKKGEFSFANDELIEGGKRGQMNNGVNYREVRQYQSDFHLVRFYFVTRSYNTYMESILADLSEDPKPDVIIMNSCLWDISRYGRGGVEDYKKNLELLFTRMKEVLSEDCLFVWNTTLPISKNAKGGFLVPEIEFMNNTLRLDILEANFYARQVVVRYGFDILDMHYYLRNQLHRRAHDGIHWDMTAHRRMTNLLMTHISEAWLKDLPGRARDVDRNGNKRLQSLPCRQTGGRNVTFDANSNNEHLWNQHDTREVKHAFDFNHRVLQMDQPQNLDNWKKSNQVLQMDLQQNLDNWKKSNHRVLQMDQAQNLDNWKKSNHRVLQMDQAQNLDNWKRYSHRVLQMDLQQNLDNRQKSNQNSFNWQPYAQSSYQPPSRSRQHATRDVPYRNISRVVHSRPVY